MIGKVIRISLVALILVCTCIIVYLVYIYVQFQPSPSVRVAEAFLNAFLQREENEALNYLSSDTRNLVKALCSGGVLSNCAQQVISPSWGDFQTSRFNVGSPSTNTILFNTFWSNLPYDSISVILIINSENDHPVVSGWYGFINTSNEEEDRQLLKGERQDNKFPPN
jgi:hypothetical protein